MSLPKLPRRAWLIGATVDSFILSIICMYITEQFLHERISIAGTFFGLQKTFNTGIAFSVNLGAYQELFIVAAILIVAVMAVKTSQGIMEEIGFGFILGGGIANVFDRFLDGKVTDMIQVGSFPVFNIADTCINVGIGLLLLHAFLRHERVK